MDLNGFEWAYRINIWWVLIVLASPLCNSCVVSSSWFEVCRCYPFISLEICLILMGKFIRTSEQETCSVPTQGVLYFLQELNLPIYSRRFHVYEVRPALVYLIFHTTYYHLDKMFCHLLQGAQLNLLCHHGLHPLLCLF